MKFESLYYGGILPQRSTAKSAGYDIHSAEYKILHPNTMALIKTGITVEMKDNEYLAICSRSGLAVSGIVVFNAPGIVDADYFPREIKVLLKNTTKERFEVKPGDRIAQGIFHTYGITVDDEASGSRTGGFGSTGVNQEVSV